MPTNHAYEACSRGLAGIAFTGSDPKIFLHRDASDKCLPPGSFLFVPVFLPFSY